MSLKSDALEVGLAIGAAALLLWWLSRKGNAAAAYSTVDGAATDAALTIPGMSLLTDPATGNFDPAAAGNAAGLAVNDWITSGIASIGAAADANATQDATNGAMLADGNRQIFGVGDAGGTVAPWGSLGTTISDWWRSLSGG